MILYISLEFTKAVFSILCCNVGNVTAIDGINYKQNVWKKTPQILCAEGLVLVAPSSYMPIKTDYLLSMNCVCVCVRIQC